MGKMVVLVLFLLVPGGASAQTEIGLAGSVRSTNNLGESDSDWGGSFRIVLAVGHSDLFGSVGYQGLHKTGTLDGYQVNQALGVRYWIGPDFFVNTVVERDFADTQEWTKTAWFIRGGGGLCIRYGERGSHRHLVGAEYFREVSTDAVAPNRTRGLIVKWEYDMPVYKNVFVQGKIGYTWARYLQFGDWRSGGSTTLTIGVAWFPHGTY